MYRDKEELHKIAGWPGVSGGSRQKALEHLQCEYTYMYKPASRSVCVVLGYGAIHCFIVRK